MLFGLGQRIGRYRVYDGHAHGAAGRRYHAWSPEGRRVFIRLCEPTDPARFAASVSRLQAIAHPGALPVLEWGRQGGRSWVARPYCAGQLLSATLADGPLPCRMAIAIGSELSGLLAAVHERGELVRDLTPDNVILPEEGGVRLLDLGIDPSPRPWHPSTPLSDPMAPGYVAPERVQRGEEGFASDLYALGALLYEMLAGRPAFVGPREVVEQAQVQAPAPRPSRYAPVPVELDDLVAELLAAIPSERPAHAGEVFARLQDV